MASTFTNKKAFDGPQKIEIAFRYVTEAQDGDE